MLRDAHQTDPNRRSAPANPVLNAFAITFADRFPAAET
jgi:hypothetical protein